MPERKTNTVTTPSNHTVELKEYISAGEFLDINDAKQGDVIEAFTMQRVANEAA